jgi:hypothetical protein
LDEDRFHRDSKVTTDMPLIYNIRQDPFERAPSINGETLNDLGGGYMNDFYAREFWRFVLVQKTVAELAKTAIDYPPMQDPASFNLDEVKKQVEAHDQVPRGRIVDWSRRAPQSRVLAFFPVLIPGPNGAKLRRIWGDFSPVAAGAVEFSPGFQPCICIAKSSTSNRPVVYALVISTMPIVRDLPGSSASRGQPIAWPALLGQITGKFVTALDGDLKSERHGPRNTPNNAKAERKRRAGRTVAF